MINPALFVVIGKGIGQSIAFLYLWIDEKLRRHYCPPLEFSYGDANVLFYDREFIKNLKVQI